VKMIEIWINCPDKETARKISDSLISNRRVACSNIYSKIQSCYRWKGEIENQAEIPLLLKTREENFSLVVDDVRKIHPYEVPSIIGLPVELVNKEYLAWIYNETE